MYYEEISALYIFLIILFLIYGFVIFLKKFNIIKLILIIKLMAMQC